MLVQVQVRTCTCTCTCTLYAQTTWGVRAVAGGDHKGDDPTQLYQEGALTHRDRDPDIRPSRFVFSQSYKINVISDL